MKKKSSVAGKLLNDFNRLIPFIGLLFVISGVMGLIFVQQPLNQTQELRSDASEPINNTIAISEQTTLMNDCGKSCSSNADCAINLRCYNNTCRLVTNPSSLTCSTATKKTVLKKYNQVNDLNTKAPLKKGDNLIPDSKSDYKDIENVNPTDDTGFILDKDIPENETAFDLIIKMLKDKQQSLPTTIILIGIGLLSISLIILLIVRLMSSKKTKVNHKKKKNDNRINVKSHHVIPGNTPKVTPKTSRNKKVKELINTLNNQSTDQNQG